ncbi:helix-turn-helix domain-containing protein [Herbaspirillum sp. alder98]|uniref:helix-turn-helix domain-containing protein n=1 Tax=Herbaspirillum sp. alder98 TaxID=2913096 RepID=UPI001CD824BD|nr:helix-turn-helix transcriptional regulator [Herbaspirillum sp. alder98]
MGRMIKTAEEESHPHASSMEALGRILRHRRTSGGIKLIDAADQLRISKSTLSRLENGKSTNIELLFTVLEGLGLNLLVTDKAETREALEAVQLCRDADEDVKLARAHGKTWPLK